MRVMEEGFVSVRQGERPLDGRQDGSRTTGCIGCDPVRMVAVIVATAALVAFVGAEVAAQSPSRASASPATPPVAADARGSDGAVPAPCASAPVIPLSLLRPWSENVELGGTRCFAITGEPGEFVRAVVEMGAKPPLTGMSVELFGPGDTAAVINTGLGNVERQPISWELGTSDPHFLVLRQFWSIAGNQKSVPTRVRIEAVESAALAQARRDALAADPRVAWLSANALPVRSISPDDDEFADLEPLRTTLEGVRVVLLGEADHGSGSDFLAKSRLVKFLHQELGFDVLALESPMYDMEVSWERLRAGEPARESFALGALGQWAGSAQMQSLIDYMAANASGERPLTLAGFDNQPQRASMEFFARDLGRFLTDRGIGGPLVQSGTPEAEMLEALAEVRYRRGLAPLPDSARQRAFLSALDETTERVASLDDDQAMLWAQILRGTARHARRVFAPTAGVSFWDAARLRNEQMGENLIWLAEERFPARKIIAWAGSAHVMRLPEIPAGAGSGPSMGQYVWEAFGEDSYSIAVVSHSHAAQRIVPDQHVLPEFEQLMATAGFEYGLVDLRRAAREGSWAGGSFLARPVAHRTDEAVWSDAVDAFLFIRLQDRWQRAENP